MSSEIRVNSLSSRTGLSTVTFTDTGPIFSGITTFQDNSGFNVGTGGSIFSPASNTVTLGTNNAERLRIASDGTVIVGTDTTVNPILRILGTSAHNSFIQFADGDSNNVGQLQYSHSSNALILAVNGGEKLRITSAGNIGVGVVNPGAKTHIDSTTSNTPLVVEASQTNRSRIVFRNNVETGTECNIELFDDDLRFVTNSGERLRITSDGKIGVGENSPDRLLHLKAASSTAYSGGSDTADYNFLKIENTTNDKSAGIFFQIGGNGEAAITATEVVDGNTDIAFQNRGGGVRSEKLRITSGGDLLLGGHSAYTYDDTGSSNVILDIYGGATAGKRGILSLSGRVGSDNGDIGTIWFNNDNNSGSGPGNTMKLSAVIQAKITTSDGNASNDAGAYMQLMTKPEGGTVTERLILHSNGSVTKPDNPAFLVGRTGGNQTFTLGTFPFNVARINVGNCWNTSTYKFTAPTAGIYYFFGQVYYNSGDGDFRVQIRKTSSGSAIQLCTAACDTNGSDESLTISIMESLSVGDTIELYSDQNTGRTCYYNINNDQYGAHTYFMGYLVG